MSTGLVLISSLFSLIFIFQNVFKMQTNTCIETVHKARHYNLVKKDVSTRYASAPTVILDK